MFLPSVEIVRGDAVFAGDEGEIGAFDLVDEKLFGFLAEDAVVVEAESTTIQITIIGLMDGSLLHLQQALRHPLLWLILHQR